MRYLAAIIVLLAAPLVSAPLTRLVREIDLNQAISVKPDFAPFAYLAFSPDEKWLAVAVGARQTEHRKYGGNVDLGPSSLLLLPLNGTAVQLVHVDPSLRPSSNPAWSPDSATILVEGFAKSPQRPLPGGIAKLWNLRGDELMSRQSPGFVVGKTADLPIGGIFGFLDSAHLLARQIPAKGQPAAFETINLQGQVVDTWTIPEHWTVADISPERGLLAIFTDQASKTLIVDNQSKKVVLTRVNPFGFQGYGNPSLHGRWQYLAESGKTLCSVGSIGTLNPGLDGLTECWDVDSGRRIAKFDGFLGGAPAAASSRGSRLVLTRNIAFPIRGDGALVFPHDERVVWDFCSGAEIASWGVPQTANTSHSADHVAISSSGRYVAETAGPLLRIYQLP